MLSLGGGLFQFNMEQRRREQEHHEKQQELQQLKHKDKSQQSEYIHTQTLRCFGDPTTSVPRILSSSNLNKK